MVVGVSTTHSTTSGRVGGNSNVIAIELEIGHVCSGSRNCERTSRIGGYRLSALCPVHESVTRVGGGSQDDIVTVVEVTFTAHGTTLGRVGGNSDVVVIEFEVGHVRSISGYSEAVFCIGGNLNIILCPVYEMVTSVGRSGQRGSRTIHVRVSTRHCTTNGRTDVNGDVIAVHAEVGHE